jgi:hypothetical protein
MYKVVEKNHQSKSHTIVNCEITITIIWLKRVKYNCRKNYITQKVRKDLFFVGEKQSKEKGSQFKDYS